MNWFQIVFLRENSQVNKAFSLHAVSCELISNCIFTWEFTSVCLLGGCNSSLWIDFKLYFYVRIHKNGMPNAFTDPVVNWFQIVFLRENSQAAQRKTYIAWGCELISNCIFTWEFTRYADFLSFISLLWIDFKLYFYVRIHKNYLLLQMAVLVVNWFQIVFLRENSQEPFFCYWYCWGCELISNCIFTWEFTRKTQNKR